MPPGVSRFVSDSILTFLLAIFNRGLGIGAGIVLARYLGPVGKGYVAYAPIALELFVTAMNGVSQAVTFQFGRNGLPGAAVHKAMMRIVTAASIPSALALGIAAWRFPSQHVLIASAIALPFAMYTTAATGLLLGADRVAETNVQRTIISSGFNAITVALVVFFHADYRLVLCAWVASYAGAAIYTYIASRPFISGNEPATREIVREQASFGATSGVAQLAGYVNMRIDVIVVSFALGAKAVGLYTLAVGLAELLWQVSAPLAMSAFPRIAIGDEQTSVAFTAKLIRHILAIVLPIGLIFFFAGPPLMGLLYGRAFEPSGEALRWILPGVVAYAAEVPLGYYLMVRLARPWVIVAIQTASIVVCGGLTLATVHTWGINGAAAATSLTYVAVVIVKGTVFARATGTSARDILMVDRDDLSQLKQIVLKVIARVIPARA
jgi:O-antigen/teichoic acid export membrane protein